MVDWGSMNIQVTSYMVTIEKEKVNTYEELLAYSLQSRFNAFDNPFFETRFIVLFY